MVDHESAMPDTLAQQLRKHLVSLRQAGVEWVATTSTAEVMPVAMVEPAPAVAVPSAPTPADEAASVPASGLFTAGGEAPIPVEERKRELEVLAEQVGHCTRCPELAARKQAVFGDGCLDPELCFIGEAPGAEEDLQGLPFVGPAGKLLNRIINACGFRREEVYICNILRCRPPGNRLPLVSEAANCRPFLERQLELVRPKFIVALGACAAQNLLGTTLSIGRLRRRFHDYQGIPVLCTYHPAYLLRSPEKKVDVWDDMKMLLARMGRPVPAQKKPGSAE